MATIIGTSGNDNPLNGTTGEDNIDGLGGNDVIWGDAEGGGDYLGASDTISGGSGDDTIYGQGGDDIIHGGTGSDRIFGGSRGILRNELYGDDGNDTLKSISSGDLVDGGAGEGDYAVIDREIDNAGGLSNVAITADFTNASTAEGVTMSDGTWVGNVERVFFTGGGGNDVIVGTNYDQPDDFADTLRGEGGNDTLHGLDGSDVLSGGAGSDMLYGGDGADYIYTDLDYSGGGNSSEDDVDVAHGNAGDDFLVGNSVGRELLYGDEGNDTINSYGPGDELYGGDGDDFVEWSPGDPGVDAKLDGGAGQDTLRLGFFGGSVGVNLDLNVTAQQIDSQDVQITGFETFYVDGTEANDSFVGLVSAAGGNDEAYGRGGADYFQGGFGDDLFDGGEGEDTIGYSGALTSDNFAITLIDVFGDGSYVLTQVQDLRPGAPEGTDTLVGAEYLEFNGVRYTVAEAIAVLGVPTNAAPTLSAADDTASVLEDAQAPDLGASGAITFDDIDLTDAHTVQVVAANGNSLGGTLVAVVSDPATGTGPGTATWTYTVANAATQSLGQGQSAQEQFNVTIDDGHGGTVSRVVIITVTGTNDMPVASAAVAAVGEDATISGSVAATDADAGQTATLVYALVGTTPAGLTFSADGSYTFDASSYDSLAAGEELELTVPFTASDATSTSVAADLVITITGTNDMPVASAAVAAVAEDATISGSVAATDADAGQTATLVYALVGTTPAGLTFSADGSYTFDASSYDSLAAGEELELTVPFTASDATSTSVAANLVITITGTNDMPVASAAVAAVAEDATISGSVAATDADAGQTATLVYALVDTAPAGLIFSANGSYSFDASSYDSLAAGEELELNVPFTASDATSISSAANLVITITGTNDAPQIGGDATGGVIEDGTLTATGSLTVSDADQGEAGFQAIAANTVGANGYGTFAMTTAGAWTYTLNNALPAVQALGAGQTLIDNIVAQSIDGTAQTLTVTITGTADDVNTAPVITSNGGGATAQISLAEGTLQVTDVNAVDADAGQVLTFSIASGADAARFAIDAASGVLRFITAPDFENPVDAGGNNVYDVVVAVADGAGGADTQAIEIAVSNVSGTTFVGSNAANTFNGTGEEDLIRGLGGDDKLNGADGNDTLEGGLGADTLIGGNGIDTATYAGSSASVNVNLQARTASGGDAAGDKLNAIENLTGSAFNDTLVGSKAVNNLSGGGGNDVLRGLGGADLLTGGLGADTFDFDAIADSGLGSNADLIADFQIGLDRIDLSTIDANTGALGNQAFSGTLLSGPNTAFTGAGQLRVFYDAQTGMTIIQGNVDGDAEAEFEIHLIGAVPVTSGDFGL